MSYFALYGDNFDDISSVSTKNMSILHIKNKFIIPLNLQLFVKKTFKRIIYFRI